MDETRKNIKVDRTTTDPVSGNQTRWGIDISPAEVAKLGELSPIGQLTKVIKDKINRKKSPEQPQSPTQTEAVKEAPKEELPRQLKDPKSEMMVTSPKTGKTFVIYKSEWPEHEKSGHTVAEEVEQLDEIPFLAPLAGMAVRYGAAKIGKGLLKKGVGAVAGAVFRKSKQPGEEGTATA